MSREILQLDATLQRQLNTADLCLHDLEALRLILTGGSVIDWRRLNLSTAEEVDSYLRLLAIDLSSEEGQERLRFVYTEATNYLEEHLEMPLPRAFRAPEDLRMVFLEASRYDRRFKRRQVLACTILKLMHVICHMEAAELRLQSAVPEATLLARATEAITRFGDQLRREGYPILAFYGSRKTRFSSITKMLAKRETLAATIFDKVRFRVVLEHYDQLLPMLTLLQRRLFPFNYVIPGESHNNLLDWKLALHSDPRCRSLAGGLQELPGREEGSEEVGNDYSGQSYRTINFVADYPVRLRPEELKAPPHQRHLLGDVVFIMVEFQIVDQHTAQANERGENAHHRYKKRQLEVVERRLLSGWTPGS